MINTCSNSLAATESSNEDKLHSKTLEMAEYDSSVYDMYDFSHYPADMNCYNRLVYCIILS